MWKRLKLPRKYPNYQFLCYDKGGPPKEPPPAMQYISKKVRSQQHTANEETDILNELNDASLIGTDLVQEAKRKKKWADSSFIVNLFRGQIEYKEMFPFPSPMLTKTQHDEVVNMIEEIRQFLQSKKKLIMEHDSAEAFSKGYLEELIDYGIFSINTPTQYGGLGFNLYQICAVLEAIAEYDLSLSCMLLAHNVLACEVINRYASQTLKESFGHKVGEGKLATFLLEERARFQIRSSSVSTKARKVENGYVLNGIKFGVLLANIADLFIVFAVLQIPAGNKFELSAFLVERKNNDGIIIGTPLKKMGMRSCPQCLVQFKDVMVPAENMLGIMGEGFSIATEITNQSRIVLTSIIAGMLKGVHNKTMQFAGSSFKNDKSKYVEQVVKNKIAKSAIQIYVIESMAYLISGRQSMDEGRDMYLESACSKLYAILAISEISQYAFEIFGDLGYYRALGLEQMIRDSQFYVTCTGTRHLLLLFIALTGFQYATGHDMSMQEALKSNIESYSGLLFNLTPIINLMDSKSETETKEESLERIHPQLQNYVKLCHDHVLKFGQVVAELVRRHQKSIVDEQFTLVQIAKAAVDILAILATISRCSSSLHAGSNTAFYELQMTIAFCDEKLLKNEKRFDIAMDSRTLALGKKLRKVLETIASGQLKPEIFNTKSF